MALNTPHFRSLTRQPFGVGPWHVIPLQQCMQREGHTVTLPPSLLLLLRYFAAHNNEYVAADRVHEAFDDDEAITAATLPVLMAALHEALHLTDTDPWIETTSDGHYRLVADIAFYDHVTHQRKGRTAFKVGGQTKWFDTDDTVDEDRAYDKAHAARQVWLKRGAFLGALVLIFVIVVSLRQTSPDPPAELPAPTISNFPGYETDGALSPDGNHLAFAHQQNPQHNAQLLLKSLNDQQQTQPLTNNEQHHRNPTWSPDGNQLAFLRFPNIQSNSCHIVLLDLEARTEQTLAPCGEKPVPDLAWSPDGTTLVFSAVTVAGAPSQLVALTVATGERRGLTEPPGGILGDTDPSFSPDGRWLAFTRQVHPQDNDLFLIPAQGGTPRAMTQYHRPVRGHTWTSDGEHLLFAIQQQGVFQLWQLRLDGSRSRPFPLDDVETTYPRLAYGSARLVYLRQPTRSRIWKQDLLNPTSPPEPVLPPRFDARQPAFSPVDDRWVFIAVPNRYNELWLQEPDSNAPSPLASLPGHWINIPRWSADGEQVVFTVSEGFNFDLYRVPSGGGSLEALTRTAQQELAPSWSPDGAWVYYASRESGDWDVWRIPVDKSTEPEQVTLAGGRVSMADAQGTWLYYTKSQTAGLWRKNLAEGFEEQILTTLDPADSGNWVLTRQGIYFVQRLPDGTTPVLFFDLASETTTTVFTPPQPIPGFLPALTISHNHRQALFTQTEWLENDLMQVEITE